MTLVDTRRLATTKLDPRHKYVRSGKRVLDGWKPAAKINPSAEAPQVLDFFSGCGGMSLGFAALAKSLGAFRLLAGVDINQRSLDTYQLNLGVPGLLQDVRELADNREHLKSFLGNVPGYDAGKPLVLIGCAPCQGFTAHRKRSWSVDDVRNGLVASFAEVAAALSPDVVIMENVPELLSGKYWMHFEAFRSRLEAEGYTVKQMIHNAAEFGVPQERFRAVVVAMRTPTFSMPLPQFGRPQFRTVRDAIGSLGRVAAGEIHELDPMHKSASHRQSTLDVIRAVAVDGGSRPEGVGPPCLDRVKGYYDVYGRLFWDRPAITITHYARNPASGRFVHPEQDRGLTMREAARLQGFPDGFVFVGPFDDVFRQIGEAVPPPLSLAVAASVLANLNGDAVQADTDGLLDGPVNDSFAGVIAGIKSRR